MCSSPPWLVPPRALRTAGAAPRLPNFRSYCKEMREHICTSCIFLPSQTERDLETFPGHWGGSSSCSLWDVEYSEKERILCNSISKTQGHTWSKGGLQPVACPLLFVKLHQIRARVQVQFQADLLDGTPHYLRDLLIVFSTQKAGNESTSFPPCADSSGFWGRHHGEAVIQSCSHVTTWPLMSNTFLLSILLSLRKGLQIKHICPQIKKTFFLNNVIKF